LIKPTRQTSWGVIRYACGSGSFPDEDAAAFNGWYSDRADALAEAEHWAARYPQWIVGLVSSDLIWFGNGAFEQVRDRVLTAREARFAKAAHSPQPEEV
jgi:hypothetical protein